MAGTSTDGTGGPGRRTTGMVRWFSAKGFGFIARRGGDDVYVHHSQIVGDGFRSLSAGRRVEFSVRGTRRGPEAVDVELVSEGRAPRDGSRRTADGAERLVVVADGASRPADVHAGRPGDTDELRVVLDAS